MEYLRWIFLLFGIAVLLVVYFISRSRRNAGVSDDLDDRDNGDYLFDEIDHDALLAGEITEPGVKKLPASENDPPTVSLADISCELGTPGRPPIEENDLNEVCREPVLDSQMVRKTMKPSLPNESLIDNLFGKKKGAGPASVGDSQPEKIIVLHIGVHPSESIQGVDLVRVFETRGYKFGEMDIYHACFEGRTIFSIVNMVEPGWFDPASMEEFSTPGISLFLRLPGPLPSDVAFDVLLNEARAIALGLDAAILNDSRGTLTQQMEQHIREELQQYDVRYKH